MKRVLAFVLAFAFFMTGCQPQPPQHSDASSESASVSQSQSQAPRKLESGYDRLTYHGSDTGNEKENKTAYGQSFIDEIWTLLNQETRQPVQSYSGGEEQKNIRLYFYNQDGFTKPEYEAVVMQSDNLVVLHQTNPVQEVFYCEGIYQALVDIISKNNYDKVEYINLYEIFTNVAKANTKAVVTGGGTKTVMNQYLKDPDNLYRLQRLFQPDPNITRYDWRFLSDAINLPSGEPDILIEIEGLLIMGVYQKQACAYIDDLSGRPLCWYKIPQNTAKDLLKLIDEFRNPPPPKPNRLLEKLGLEDIPDNAVAVIINYPTDELLQQVGKYDHVTHNPGERALVIPIMTGTTLTVNKLMESPDPEELFTVGAAIYSRGYIKDGYALLINSIRPESLPQIKIQVKGQNYQGDYLYTYNGKDGNPDIEYITTDQALNLIEKKEQNADIS